MNARLGGRSHGGELTARTRGRRWHPRPSTNRQHRLVEWPKTRRGLRGKFAESEGLWFVALDLVQHVKCEWHGGDIVEACGGAGEVVAQVRRVRMVRCEVEHAVARQQRVDRIVTGRNQVVRVDGADRIDAPAEPCSWENRKGFCATSTEWYPPTLMV